jgi:very-short-patch-repair endonuclease
MTARELQKIIGYKEWRNFNNLIKKTIQIIGEQHANKTYKEIKLPRGATRKILDYNLTEDAKAFIEKMSAKPYSKSVITRNEIVIIEQIKRYYEYRNIKIQFQFKLARYRYDCKISDKILFEFDEPHHLNKRQTDVDRQKDKSAISNGYSIIRCDIYDDIIDIIIKIDKHLSVSTKR